MRLVQEELVLSVESSAKLVTALDEAKKSLPGFYQDGHYDISAEFAEWLTSFLDNHPSPALRGAMLAPILRAQRLAKYLEQLPSKLDFANGPLCDAAVEGGPLPVVPKVGESPYERWHLRSWHALLRRTESSVRWFELHDDGAIGVTGRAAKALLQGAVASHRQSVVAEQRYYLDELWALGDALASNKPAAERVYRLLVDVARAYPSADLLAGGSTSHPPSGSVRRSRPGPPS
jgi:hypothetical protein